MEKKNIKLYVCNQEIAVSIGVEQESDFRKAAKTVNDDFAKYKAAYSSVEDEQKQILDDAKDMAEDDLTDFDIHYVGDGLAFIALYLRVKESRHKLYKKHLVSMMDKLVDGYITLSCAISLIKYTQSPEFIESITNKQS